MQTFLFFVVIRFSVHSKTNQNYRSTLYVKICKNGQRFYTTYNWKYQPHLVHFILISMNTHESLYNYILFNIMYRQKPLGRSGCFGWQINLDEQKFLLVCDHFFGKGTNCVQSAYILNCASNTTYMHSNILKCSFITVAILVLMCTRTCTHTHISRSNCSFIFIFFFFLNEQKN